MSSNIGVAALLCVGAIYVSYAMSFYPLYVAVAALGCLAYYTFAQPRAKRPPFRTYMSD